MSSLAITMHDPKLPEADRIQARTKLQEIKKDGSDTDKAFFAKWLLEN
jgi:hypothetical protein